MIDIELLSTKVSYLVGFVVIAAYLAVSYRKKTPALLPDAIILLLASTSIPPCFKVITTFYKYQENTIKGIGSSEQTYIIIGAFAVIWLSADEIFRKFKNKINP